MNGTNHHPDSHHVHQYPMQPPVLVGTTKFPPNPSIKNIMITGGAGFIGSWVTRHLTLTYPDSYNIIVYDKIDYCASLHNLKTLVNCANYTFVYGDITDHQAVLRCMRVHNIDTVLHFAAMSHVDLSFGNSFEFTHVNVMGTHVMLAASVKMGVKKFVHVSTDEVNGETKHGDPDLLEDSILAPTNPYSASKAAAEMLVNAYSKSFGLGCVIVRSNNVYGPNQFPEKIIPKFSCLLDRSRPLFLHGSGKNTRRYLYASDAADAFDTILHLGINGEIYNVDSADEMANIDLAMRMLDMFNLGRTHENVAFPSDPAADTEWKQKWIKFTRDRPFNDMRYAVDATKLKKLGWKQKVRFEEGLRMTVDWYREFGRTWWGTEVEGVLTAFPEVKAGEVVADQEAIRIHVMNPKPSTDLLGKSDANSKINTTPDPMMADDGLIEFLVDNPSSHQGITNSDIHTQAIHEPGTHPSEITAPKVLTETINPSSTNHDHPPIGSIDTHQKTTSIQNGSRKRNRLVSDHEVAKEGYVNGKENIPDDLAVNGSMGLDVCHNGDDGDGNVSKKRC